MVRFMKHRCHYEKLDRVSPGRGWEPCTAEVVMDALCKTYRDAIAAFELLAREGVVLNTPFASYRHVIEEVDDVKEG
jgi:hypothetical protein